MWFFLHFLCVFLAYIKKKQYLCIVKQKQTTKTFTIMTRNQIFATLRKVNTIELATAVYSGYVDNGFALNVVSLSHEYNGDYGHRYFANLENGRHINLKNINDTHMANIAANF